MITTPDQELLKSSIRNIPDFPKKGIQFKDITTALKQPAVFKQIVDQLAAPFRNMGITRVAGIESRGFITGGALAYELGVGFVPIRKLGKLPAVTFSKTYDLEYGKDSLEIHRDALEPGETVLLHDDLLATGGTALAAIELLQNFDIKNIHLCFIAELDFLQGRQRLAHIADIFSLIHF
jgi:adenine phosphoribosyltransferase